jgi:lipid A 3-O-deacylase
MLSVLLVALALAGPAAAEPQLTSGTADFTLAGAYSISHNLSGTPEGITGFQLVPHLGLFVTDEHGPRWLRGSLELLAEPTWLHLDTRESTNQVGLSALTRWVFAGEGRVRWYAEAGAGLITGESGIPQANCDANFILQAGAGVLLFWSETYAVNLGYRFHHISNGSVCTPNPSLNSAVLILGLSAFFR